MFFAGRESGLAGAEGAAVGRGICRAAAFFCANREDIGGTGILLVVELLAAVANAGAGCGGMSCRGLPPGRVAGTIITRAAPLQ